MFVFPDVYVFGVGEKVNKEELNNLASHKSKETHLFILKDYVTLGIVFNSIISKYEITSSPMHKRLHLCRQVAKADIFK